jgi:hypothetical protein
MTTDIIQYAFRVEGDKETPCHVSDIKSGDVFYLVTDGKRSALCKATGDAFSSEVNNRLVWSIPHENHK